jgi:hypothetical protein
MAPNIGPHPSLQSRFFQCPCQADSYTPPQAVICVTARAVRTPSKRPGARIAACGRARVLREIQRSMRA